MKTVPNCGPAWLNEKLARGEVLVIDGAMGTELEARGVAMHDKVWSARAAIEKPDAVLAAHCDYIRAGAQVVIANTFASGRHMLEPSGFADDVESINRKAVMLALQARDQSATDRPVAVAGSICEWAHPESGFDDEKLERSFREQADLLVEAGVELLIVEMAQHPVDSPAAVKAALATGLPVWVGLSARRRSDGVLAGFDSDAIVFEDVVRNVAPLEVALLAVMHTPIADTSDALALVRKYWSGPLGVYPESGHFVMPNWQFVDIIEPADLVTETQRWIENGVQVVGGCCGLSTPHIRALHRAFS